MTYLPSDPAILQSYLNTLLRDRFGSLSDLSDEMDIDPDDLEKRLEAAGLFYEPDRNRISPASR